MKRTIVNPLAGVLAAVMLTGCSEVGFQDVFGAGKYSPDETQVNANQALSMPPDLQLRPPASGAPPPAPAAPAPAPAVTAQPPAYGAPQPGTQTAAAQTPAQVSPAPGTVQSTQPTTVDPAQFYAQYGISTVKPDGTPKTQAELDDEMRQVQAQRKKAQNPNYGTVWNLPEALSDWWSSSE